MASFFQKEPRRRSCSRAETPVPGARGCCSHVNWHVPFVIAKQVAYKIRLLSRKQENGDEDGEKECAQSAEATSGTSLADCQQLQQKVDVLVERGGN